MLAHVAYDAEDAVKRDVVAGYLKLLAPREALQPLVRSVKPREYRTTSRRRVWRDRRGGMRLVHGDMHESASASSLEPPAHLRVYARIAKQLDVRRDPLAEALNHVIVRGTYDQFVLILNIMEVSADIIRAARSWVKSVQRDVPEVTSAWLYVDPKGSRYYLDTDRPLRGMAEKKISGERVWRQTLDDVTYQVGVFSFSQVNLAMVPTLVKTVRETAQLRPTDVLADLYGGYGLFGAAMAKDVQAVVTMDADEATVDNARYNIRRAGGTVRAIALPVNPANLAKVVDHADVVILDPPRSGTDPNVITAVAGLKPRQVVHVFCGPDEIRRSIGEWKAAGYAVSSMIPVDLFPGTAGLEVIVGFQPKA